MIARFLRAEPRPARLDSAHSPQRQIHRARTPAWRGRGRLFRLEDEVELTAITLGPPCFKGGAALDRFISRRSGHQRHAKNNLEPQAIPIGRAEQHQPDRQQTVNAAI